MQMKKKLCAILACVCLLSSNISYADMLSVSATSNATQVTDTNVKVINYVDGEEVILYTGPISQFENGSYIGTDFTGKDFLVVLEWGEELALLYYIYPIRSTTQDSTMSSIIELETDDTVSNTSNSVSGNLISNEEDITFSSQIKINGVNTGEDGLRIIDDANLQCLFNVSNNTNTEKEITLLLATYDDNKKMVNVKKSDIEIPASLSGNVSLVYQFDAETEKNAKLMLWHSGMMPIRAAVNFDGDSGVNAYYYDANNRLIQIDKTNGKSIFYTYDKMGNLLTKTVSGGEDNV